MVPWILIAVLVLIVLLGIVAIFAVKKGGKKPTNYYSLFIMGAIWVPFGIIIMMMEPESSIGNIFFILGWIYFVMGIMHKDEWDKKSPYLIKNKFWRWAVIIGVLVLLVLGFIVFLGVS